MARTRFSSLTVIPNTAANGPANKYDPEFCWTVRELAQQGLFVEEWCAAIGVTMSTLYNWANRYPEFEDAMHQAWYLLRAYWSKQARESIIGVGRPPSVLIKILETRFPETWGKTNPRITQEAFENRPGRPVDPQDDDAINPEMVKGMDRDLIRDRIAVLEARRAVAKENQ